MTNIPAISAAVGCALLMGAPAAADETSVQTSIEAGQWESIAVNVAQVSWSSFQPEVQVTGWTDSTRAQHADLHKSGNWAGTWIAVGLPMSENHVKR